MKNKIFNLLIVTFLILVGSCTDYLDKTPLDGPSDVSFLKTEEELAMAINGIYNNLWFHSISASGQWEYLLDCTTDISWDRNGGVFTDLGNGSQSPTDESFATLWEHLYKGIARCNFVIENIDRIENTSQETIENAEGQVRFLRAYWYHQLISLWGDVPLVTQTYGLNENKVSRTNKAEIVDFLLSELDIASQNLPDSWANENKGRATKGAALALKSRIALYAGRYDIAASSAKQVIDLNIYELYPDYRALFQYEGESCSEVIFEIMYQYGIEDHRMSYSVGSRNARCTSTKVPSQSMVDSYECVDGMTIDKSPLYNPAKPFENRDPRLKQSIAVPGDIFLGYQFETHKDSVMCWNYNVTPAVRISNQDATNAYATFTGYCWKKMADPIDYPDNRNNSSLNFIIIRLAEVLLNYAEAKIELNQIDQDCLDAINAIRDRESVKMPLIVTAKSQTEMRQIIRRERKIELAFEGFRLQDIRRWGIAEKAMSGSLYGRPQKPYNYSDQGIPLFDNDGIPDYSSYADKLRVVEIRSFNPTRDYLWPIPQKDMDVNDQLVQNPGY
ncbi:RagB/SusD family nutrient uptake outer membrane protein [Maribellus maritimus]|uniref:RagB/SusD family nutrient uptake outer membrane protein n=1 Tax=Maribellus maritimus TaxID=2870838 RepID=UPI001EECCEA9|nr:RagB/SusD family nutrient uptake outer membrane protein [Maribellus maritimus]MCG6189540.1 RagB/SusD family nutrient uptake outer membrane protein [Maribellus maritimus]